MRGVLDQRDREESFRLKKIKAKLEREAEREKKERIALAAEKNAAD